MAIRTARGDSSSSLRGQDPELDLAALRDQGGRRIDLVNPDESLLLAKPDDARCARGRAAFRGRLARIRDPRDRLGDGGGDDADTAPRLSRLEVTPGEQTLVEPQDELQMRIVAYFADGTSRDITRLAVYDPADRIATVDHEGRVQRQAFGETTLIVRYLDRQTAVPLAFVPARDRLYLA